MVRFDGCCETVCGVALGGIDCLSELRVVVWCNRFAEEIEGGVNC